MLYCIPAYSLADWLEIKMLLTLLYLRSQHNAQIVAGKHRCFLHFRESEVMAVHEWKIAHHVSIPSRCDAIHQLPHVLGSIRCVVLASLVRVLILPSSLPVQFFPLRFPFSFFPLRFPFIFFLLRFPFS